MSNEESINAAVADDDDAPAFAAAKPSTKKPMSFTSRIMIGAVVFAGIAVASSLAWVLNKNKGNQQVQAAPVDAPSGSISGTPGGAGSSPGYNAVAVDANKENYKKATETGGTNFPTIVSKDVVVAKEGAGKEQPIQPPIPPKQTEEDILSEIVARQQALVLSEATRLVNTTRKFAGEDVVAEGRAAVGLVYPEPPKSVESAKTEKSATKKGDPSKRVVAGEQFIAKFTKAVNSDYSGPVFAEIVSQGLLSGATARGSFALAQDAMTMEFSQICLKNGGCFPVKALATNLETGEYGIATDVNRRLLEKYSGMFVAALVAGGKTLLSPQSTTQTAAAGVTTTAIQRASARDVGVGVVAEGIGNIGADIANRLGARPTTAKVAQYELFSLIFSDAAVLEKLDE